MQKPLFTGACTALVTPFINGKVNYPMMEQLLRRQIEAGIRAVVISGTTGESATLSDGEKIAMIRRAKNYVGDSCLIIAGTGSNNTQHAVALSRAAEAEGADALLIVSPYYNKTTPEGIFLHYSSIAAGVQIPIILYNVPSRTGLDMGVDTYRQLASKTNIVGIKEASTDIRKITKIRAKYPTLSIWSGNDDMTVPVIALGGQGVISVISNLFPDKMQSLAQAAIAGDFDTASALQMELNPVVQLLFEEVNPIPVKAAMALIGYDCGECRLPLTAPSTGLYQKLKEILTK